MHIWDSPEIVRLVTVLLGLAILWLQARVSRKQDVIAADQSAIKTDQGVIKQHTNGMLTALQVALDKKTADAQHLAEVTALKTQIAELLAAKPPDPNIVR